MIRQDLDEIVFIKSLFTGTPGCEFGHHTLPCSGPVTHRLLWCRGGLNICQNVADRAVRCMGNRASVCAECKLRVHECWRLNPI